MTAISGVYCIRNKTNLHLYIGSAQDVHDRIKNHHWTLAKGNKNTLLQSAFKEFGIDNFETEIILTCPVDMLEYYEQQCIDQLNPEYNIQKKVRKINYRGSVRSAETKAKMSLILIGNKRGVGNKNAVGHKWSEEDKARMSTQRKGKHIDNGLTGHKLSEETKAKISASHTGKKHSDEAKLKMKLSHTDKKASEETKAKLREVMRLRKLKLQEDKID
jgi:group I intron endonuclease